MIVDDISGPLGAVDISFPASQQFFQFRRRIRQRLKEIVVFSRIFGEIKDILFELGAVLA